LLVLTVSAGTDVLGQSVNEPAIGQCIIKNSTIKGSVNQECHLNVTQSLPAPTLTIIGRDDVVAPGETYVTTITFEIGGAAYYPPGHVTIRADTSGIIDSRMESTVVVGGISTIELRNVMEGPNLFQASIPQPSGKYRLVLHTKEKNPQVTFSYTFQ
jgi:hypothetical protein